LWGNAASAQRPIMIDGYQKPHRTEVTYRFECETTKIRLSYREERRDLDAVDGDFMRAQSVELTAMKVSARRISAENFATAAAVLHRYAWITNITAECFAGEVTLSVLGMDRERWAASFRDRPAGQPWKRPDPYLRGITISPSGAVSIS
jgi:hypothetical protein